MQPILILTTILTFAITGCEKKSSPTVIKKKKQEVKEEQPQYIDHTMPGSDPNSTSSKYPQANGTVPLTQNPSSSQGNVPHASNPAPAPDPNMPRNISGVWDGKEFFSNANAEIKPLVQ
jgi:hypothetical protein